MSRITERIGTGVERAKEWMTDHRGTLIKVAVGAGAVAMGIRAIRRHNQGPASYFTGAAQDALHLASVDVASRMAGWFDERRAPEHGARVVDLTESLGTQYWGCAANISAHKAELLKHVERTRGVLAAAYRTEDGGWNTFLIEADHPDAVAMPGEPRNLRLVASMLLADGATEAALGSVSTDAEGEQHFTPVDTYLEIAGPASLTRESYLGPEQPVAFSSLIPHREH